MKILLKIICLTVVLQLFTVSDISSQTLESLLENHIDVIVDSAGNGAYTTLTEAINNAPNGGTSEYVIFLRKGTYSEKVKVPSSKTNLTLVGEDVDEVKITWDDYSGKEVNGVEIGTSTSHTLISDASDFKIINLTIENVSGEIAQAVALNFHGDRQQLLCSRLLGGQDTFYTWGAGRFFLKNSYIEGGTDFIFGRGAAYFEDCLILTNKSGSPVTASSTDENWKFGYVFSECYFDALKGVSNVPLGRPWKPFCQVVIMNSYLGSHIRPAQWSVWSGNDNDKTAYYGLYDNEGPGYKPESALSWTHILTDQEAATYTMENVFAADVKPGNFSSNWVPDLANDVIYNIVKDKMPDLKEDTLYYTPVLEELKYDGLEPTSYDSSYRRFVFEDVPYDLTFDKNMFEIVIPDDRASIEIEDPVGDVFPGDVYIYVIAPNGSSIRYIARFVPIPLKVGTNEIVKVFPNPVSDQLILQSELLKESEIEITIWDLSGNFQLGKSVKESNGLIELNVNFLSKGMYIYKITNNSTINLKGKFLK